MGIIKGGALRLFQTFLYALTFCCAAIVLGIYSYFLAVLSDRNIHIPEWEKAVEGISGVAVLYTICAVLFTCCLGGITAFAFLAILLDLLFMGGFIALAVLTRHGADSCKGYVRTPLGNGQSNSDQGFGGDNGHHYITYSVHLGLACRLNTACFAVSIVGAFLFLITAAMQVALGRHHKKEKRFGPSPSNNYTSGYGKRRWGRKPKSGTARDTELATAGTTGGLAVDGSGPDMRPSHETGYTGSTVAIPGAGLQHDKVEGTHAGYYNQPTGTGVNPYGYSAGTATNY